MLTCLILQAAAQAGATLPYNSSSSSSSSREALSQGRRHTLLLLQPTVLGLGSAPQRQGRVGCLTLCARRTLHTTSSQTWGRRGLHHSLRGSSRYRYRRNRCSNSCNRCNRRRSTGTGMCLARLLHSLCLWQMQSLARAAGLCPRRDAGLARETPQAGRACKAQRVVFCQRRPMACMASKARSLLPHSLQLLALVTQVQAQACTGNMAVQARVVRMPQEARARLAA